MHARWIVPDEERLVGLLRVVAVEEVDDPGRNFLVYGFRSFQGERALVLAHLALLCTVCRLAPDHRARGRQAGRRSGIHGAWNFRDTRDERVLTRRSDGLRGRVFVDVGETDTLHRIQVVEVAPILLEAVRCWQRLGVVAQVVFTELTRIVTEVQQKPGQRRSSRFQVGRAARQLRGDHARAQRIHAGEECIASGRAALHGDIVHEGLTDMKSKFCRC